MPFAHHLGRSALACVGLLVLIASTATPASAAITTTPAAATVAPHHHGLTPWSNTANHSSSTLAAQYCPGPGERVKTSTDPHVYLIGPGSVIYWIPDQATYYRLWDNWTVGIFDNLPSCFPYGYYTLTNANLVRYPGQDPVYIYDATCGYRWIASADIFNKYGFDWWRVISTTAQLPYCSANWYE